MSPLIGKNLISIDMADGKLLWKIPAPPLQRFYNSASPYIDGQTIYITGQGSGMKSVKIEKKGNGSGQISGYFLHQKHIP
jgi:outer membrane protein assembly factor BamB